MHIVKVISTVLQDARRLIKFARFGRADIKENFEAMPFGLDSNPIKDTVAAYSTTSVNGQSVVLGYVSTNQKAAVGEFRTYATDSSGTEVFYTWIKNNGTMEIGVNTDNFVRYSELESAFNEFKQDMNNQITTVYNNHIHTAPSGATGTPSVLGSASSADISGAKIDEIKTI